MKKYLLLALCLGWWSSHAQSFVFNSDFLLHDTIPCANDSNVQTIDAVGWQFYQTTNDQWDGPKDTSICVQADNYFGYINIALSSIDSSRHLFIAADSAHNHMLLPKNALYDCLLNLNNNWQVLDSSSFVLVRIRIPDTIGISNVYREHRVMLDSAMNGCGEYGFCIASEKFDSQYVAVCVAALRFRNLDSTSKVPLTQFTVTNSDCMGYIPSLTDTFTSLTAYANGTDYEYYMNSLTYLGLYSDTTYPSQNHISYDYVYPGNNQQTTPQNILVYVPFDGHLTLQPFTQLRGAPVSNQPGMYHNLTITIAGGTLCLTPFIEMVVYHGNTLTYRKGKIEFGGAMSCLQFKNGSTFKVDDGAILNYGPMSHEGMLAVRENAMLEIGANASLNIFNTIAVREQNTNGEPQQFYMTLNPTSTLRFMPGSRLTNEYSVDGSIRLNVRMRGGVLDDSGLPAVDKMLINRIYDPIAAGLLDLYPNPASDACHITLDASRYTMLNVTDVVGRTVYSQRVTTNSFDLLLNHLDAGIYWLHGIGSSSAVRKLVIQ